MIKLNAPFLYAKLSFILTELSTGIWTVVWSISTIGWVLIYFAGVIIEYRGRKAT